MSNNIKECKVNPGFKETKLGWIPEDWEASNIGMQIKFTGGSQPPRSTFIFKKKEGYSRLIQTRDYRTNKYKTYVKTNLTKKFCDINDIMIGRYGPPIFQIFRGLEGAYNVALIKAEAKNEKISRDYIWYFLNRRDLRAFLESLSQRSGGQTGIEMDSLKSYDFPVPPLAEQKAITRCLGAWDTSISKLDALLKEKKQLKKALMQQLISGKKRLPGFDNDWEEKRVEDFANEYSQKNDANDAIEVLSCTKYDGLVPSLEYFGRQVFGDDLSKYKVVPLNYFAYATNHIEEGSIGYQDFNELGLVSPMYTVFKTNETIDDNYLYKVLKSYKLIHEYNRRMEGSIDRRGGLRWKNFKGIKINMPPVEEQIAIARVLDTADQEINLLTAQRNQLQLQKKGLMQQLLTGKKRLKL